MFAPREAARAIGNLMLWCCANTGLRCEPVCVVPDALVRAGKRGAPGLCGSNCLAAKRSEIQPGFAPLGGLWWVPQIRRRKNQSGRTSTHVS